MTDQNVGDSVALIADIHGNIWALEAILADIERRGIRQTINLGDSLYGSLEPAATAQRLLAAQIPTICGNQDRIIYHPSEAVRQSPDYQRMHAQLTTAHLDWLRSQPASLVLGDIYTCHGSPHSDETYLLEEVTPQGVFLRSTSAISELLTRISQPVIGCGHSHVPRTVWLPSGQLVVNPGSVGIPAYEDDQPYPHVMEAGSPHTRYAIVSRSAQGWAVEQVALPYAWEIPAACARQRGRPDRARWIETGRA